MPAQPRDEHLGELLERSRRAGSARARREAVGTLVERYGQAGPKEAREIRGAFLHLLNEAPGILEQDRFLHFLVNCVAPEELSALDWKNADEAVHVSSRLQSYPLENDAVAERVTAQVRFLLRHALDQLEARGDMEQVFRLLRSAPLPLALDDVELLRLRHRAQRYELRRVKRNRRWLHGYLALQALLIFLVFPLLFVNAENGVIQERLERATELDLPEDARRQHLSFGDGLYWSIITAGSIGYGDITPVTRLGRVLAALLGVSGVITIGVVAGLVLGWVTPRV